ncbi:MAG TPA: Fe-S cluster assembly transcription factor [Burkholderiales bacterium]|nr:Fe-S cluster assembly transcription factor [Burkholderiales bacterium]
MRLTTKGRFALTAMIDLGLNQGSEPVTLAEISGRQKISLSYLEQLFGKLRRARLVESVRGPGGGYRLARDMSAVSAADIILAVDEPIDATQCGGTEDCKEGEKCLTHDLWARLNEHILEFLGSISLQQLVESQKSKQAAKEAGVAQVRDMRAAAGKRNPTPVSA